MTQWSGFILVKPNLTPYFKPDFFHLDHVRLPSHVNVMVTRAMVVVFTELEIERVCFGHITTVCCPLTESDLYPFGEDVDDSKVQINTEDGNSPYITPPIHFPFMGKLYDRIYVSLSFFSISYIKM